MKYLFVSALVAMSLYSCSSKSSQDGTAENDGKKKTENTVAQAVNASELKIAYYHIDSITEGFELFKEELARFESEGTRLQNQLMNLQQDYQNKMIDYQTGVQKQTLTMNEMAAKEKAIRSLEEKIMKLQNDDMVNFQQRQMESNQVLNNKIFDYAGQFAREKGLNVFLVYGQGSSVAYIDSAFDMTAEFVDFMNAKQQELNEGSK